MNNHRTAQVDLQQLPPDVHDRILACLCNDAHAITRLGRCNYFWFEKCLSGDSDQTVLIWQKLCWYRWYAVKEHPDRVAHFRAQDQDVMLFNGTLAQLRSFYRDRHATDLQVFCAFCELCAAYARIDEDDNPARREHPPDPRHDDGYGRYDDAAASATRDSYLDFASHQRLYGDEVPWGPDVAWKKALVMVIQSTGPGPNFSVCSILLAIIRQDAAYGLFSVQAGASVDSPNCQRGEKHSRWNVLNLSEMWRSVMTRKAAASSFEEPDQSSVADYAACMALCLAYAAHMHVVGKSIKNLVFAASNSRNNFADLDNHDDFWAGLTYLAMLEFSPVDVLWGTPHGAGAMTTTVREIANEVQRILRTTAATKIDTFTMVTGVLQVLNQRYGLCCDRTFALDQFIKELPWFECENEQVPFMLDVLLRLVLHELNATEWDGSYQTIHSPLTSDGIPGSGPFLIGSMSDDWFLDLRTQSGAPWVLADTADLHALFGVANVGSMIQTNRLVLCCLAEEHKKRGALWNFSDSWGWKDVAYVSSMWSTCMQALNSIDPLFGPESYCCCPEKKYFDRETLTELCAYKLSPHGPWRGRGQAQ